MKKIAFIAAFSFLLLSSASIAQEIPDRMIEMGTDNAGKYVADKDRLGLTAAQTASLKAIRADLAKTNAPLIKQRDDLSRSLNDLLLTEDVDLSAVSAKVSALEKLRTQITMNRITAAKQADKVLTKAQREKLRLLRAERKGIMKGRNQEKRSLKNKGK